MIERHVSAREGRAAARARVTIDQRRGRPTPEWVRALARTGLPTGHVQPEPEFTVTLTYVGAPDPHDDDLADCISRFHFTISEHPRGYTEIVVSLSAGNITLAAERARHLLHDAGLAQPISIHVQADEPHHRPA